MGASFASRVFRWAGIYGILVLTPLYFLEGELSRRYPPPITHPENFYGFIGVALAWQLAFLVIARDVQRFRPLMLPAVAEKLLAGGPIVSLCWQGRTDLSALPPALIDLLLGTLFAVSYYRTRSANLPAA
jgi:hypothetical protein